MKGKLAKVAPNSVRTTFSISSNEYQELEKLASVKRVSVSWVIRDAVSMYLQKTKLKSNL